MPMRADGPSPLADMIMQSQVFPLVLVTSTSRMYSATAVGRAPPSGRPCLGRTLRAGWIARTSQSRPAGVMPAAAQAASIFEIVALELVEEEEASCIREDPNSRASAIAQSHIATPIHWMGTTSHFRM